MTPLERLTDIAESLGATLIADRVPMFRDPDGCPNPRTVPCLLLSLGAHETTIVRPTFRQAARDAESWLAAHSEA